MAIMVSTFVVVAAEKQIRVGIRRITNIFLPYISDRGPKTRGIGRIRCKKSKMEEI